jgi:hypothetical protein
VVDSHRAVGLALLIVLVAGVASPIAATPAIAQSATPTPPTPTNTTDRTASTAATNTSAPTSGTAIPASCKDIRQNPTGQGPDYRVVRGACAIELTEGEVLSNVWFKADGERIDIWARGAGWTIRNVAITNHGPDDDPPLNLRVNSRDGVGLVTNFWASDIDSNVLFVHASHRGTIRFNGVTFLRVGEDGAYASRSGNPKKVAPVRGGGGIVGFNQAFVKKTGTGPKAGYGLRLGSDGSYITNATILSTTGPAVANTFAGGNHPNRHTGASGVLLRNVDIVTDDIGIRLNNHQDGIAPRQSCFVRQATPGDRDRGWSHSLLSVDDLGTVPIRVEALEGEEPVIDPAPAQGDGGDEVAEANAGTESGGFDF